MEPMKEFLVKTGSSEFNFDRTDVEGFDIYSTENGVYNIIKDFKSKRAEILDVDATGKKIKVEVDGDVFWVEIKSHLEQVLDSLGFNTVSTRQVKEIKAPMPGLVLSINVTEGQEVQEGERICILEAMKMENSIIIHHAATIKKILVKPGEAVEKNQILIELE